MIKVVGLDIYGTILASDDHDNEMPPRKGIEYFFDYCSSQGIHIASTSDAHTDNLKIDLETCFERYPDRRMSLDRFHYFVKMNGNGPKDFRFVLAFYQIKPRELLVIGDGPNADIRGAVIAGAHSLLVPKYTLQGKSFDFSTINLKSFK
jgi:FMN phosphatase YigB (HAD superfamily)